MKQEALLSAKKAYEIEAECIREALSYVDDEQFSRAVEALAKEIREKYPDKTIWLYTGYQWEEICDWSVVQYIDVLVDGKFEVAQKDVNLQWKGSANQRVIDVPDTLRMGKVVLHA